MKFKDIFNESSRLSKDDVEKRLAQLGDRLFGKENWKMDFSAVDSETKPIFDTTKEKWKIRPEVKIGTNYLNYGNDPKTCCCAAYVLIVNAMFHEKRHIKQINEQMVSDTMGLFKPESKLMTDITRRRMVITFFNNAYFSEYFNDLSELDAEGNGIEDTISYFKKDKLIGNKLATKILFDAETAEDMNHYGNIPINKVRTLKDIAKTLLEQRKDAVKIDYKIDKDPMNMGERLGHSLYDITDIFLKDPKYEECRNTFFKLTNGKDKDKLLMQVIANEFNDVEKMFPRLANEISQCRQQTGIIDGQFKYVPPIMIISHQINEELMSLEDSLTTLETNQTLKL